MLLCVSVCERRRVLLLWSHQMTWHGMLHCHQMVGLFSFSGLSQTACIYCRVVQHGLLLVLTASIISGQLLDTLMLCSLFTGAIFEVSMKLSPAHFTSQSQSVCISAWNMLSWINVVTEDAYDSYSPQVPHRPWTGLCSWYAQTLRSHL